MERSNLPRDGDCHPAGRWTDALAITIDRRRGRPTCSLSFRLAPVDLDRVINQFVHEFFSYGFDGQVFCRLVSVGTVEKRIVGEMKQNGLHLPEYHALHSVSGLSEGRAQPRKAKSSEVESTTYQVKTPPMRRR